MAALGPLVGALTTSPQKEGAAVAAVLFHGLVASGAGAEAEAVQEEGCVPAGPFQTAA